jgi:hypothetical protein
MNFRDLVLAVLVTSSFSAMATVSIQEKENRVQFIESIGEVAPSLSVEAYRRELEYERQELPLEVRARNEARLLAEKIQKQIIAAYEKSLQEHNDAERAELELKELIRNDLEQASPEFKAELQILANNTLHDIKLGRVTSGADLARIERAVISDVAARAQYLNEEVMDATVPEQPQVASGNASNDSGKLEYRDRQELLDSLVMNRESARWISTANIAMSSTAAVVRVHNASFQVKIEFLGVSVEAGPTIEFKREHRTQVHILAEELNPVLLPDGNWDVYKRDRRGRIIMEGGRPSRRYLSFYCAIELRFATDYKGSGGFKVAGVSASTSAQATYTNSVILSSRILNIPDYVAGRTATMEYLSNLCHQDFKRQKINDNITVEDSLNLSMRNLVSSLTFSHSRTQCARDTDCIDWFNHDIVRIWKYYTYPRCIEEPREKFRSCELRGRIGSSCMVYDSAGRLISSGNWETTCDKGLRCVQTEAASWPRFAKGKCQPINPATYRDPVAYPEYPTVNNTVDVDIL